MLEHAMEIEGAERGKARQRFQRQRPAELSFHVLNHPDNGGRPAVMFLAVGT
ncbi:hypothetical protein [Micromonospora chalcea]|uniref:hypothetical protein n=1 Tax=Micromonospora chalcea TaxID=1874 RepID=UPI00292A5DC0|nr:hypothetical protein [Micromonospora chalcea]